MAKPHRQRSSADPLTPRPATAEAAEAALLRRLACCTHPAERRHLTLELVVLYSYSGRQAEAMGHLRRLLEGTGDPAEQADYLLGLGQLMEQVGDHAGASVFYEEGLALPRAPTDTRYLLHNNLGYCRNAAHRHAEAEGHCRAAVAIDPQRHNAHKNLGVALEGQGRCAEAVAAYVRAVNCNPHDPRALQHLERMVAAQPALADAVTGLASTLQASRERVLAARRESTAGPRPKLSG
jgi:tetratricopeptide (TPR) repeat protein